MNEDESKKKNIIILILSLVIVVLICLLSYTYKCMNNNETVVVKDTITITKYEDKIRYVTKFDTIINFEYIHHHDSITDTINVHDTVVLPIEHKVSEFTIKKNDLALNEKIYYHGFKAEIDSTNIDYTFIYEPKKGKNYKVGQSIVIGIQGGYGMGFQPGGTYMFEPYIGVGVTYGFGVTF